MMLLISKYIMLFAGSLQPFADPTPYIPAVVPNLDWLGPVAGAFGGIVVAAIGGISLVWRRRQDKKDANETADIAMKPRITDGWEEVRAARREASQYYNLYRNFENLFYTTFSALRFLARQSREENPSKKFDKEILDALAITPPDTTDMSSK